MQFPPHIKEVKELLIADKIHWQNAIDTLKAESKKQKPWHTKEWKHNRELLIEKSCQVCGATEALIMQHYKHPNKLSDIFEYFFHEYRERLLNEWEAIKAERDFSHVQKQDRECCPKCDSTAIKYRKGVGNWICNSRKGAGWKGRSACGHVFTCPALINEHTPAQKKEMSKLKSEQWREHCERLNKLKERVWETRGKEIVLFSIMQTEEYYSMEKAITCCKGCASNWDLNGLLTCPKCNTNNHVLSNQLHCSKCGHTILSLDG